MNKKYTLKVFPAGAGRQVYRVIVHNHSPKHNRNSGKTAPRVIKEKGAIEQYPDWEEDEYDYE